MKKIFIALLGLLLTTACQKEKTFTINGEINGAKDSTLYLYNRSMNGIVLLDSAKIGSDGSFSFRAPAPVGGPDLYVLCLYDQIVNLSIDSTETVTIKASYPGMAENYTVNGSDNCEKIRQLSLMHSHLQQRVFEVEENTSLMGQPMVDSLQHMLRQYKDSVLRNYIYEEPQSTFAYFAMLQTIYHKYWEPSMVFVMDDSLDNRAYRAVATCWKEYYPESERAQQFYNMVERDINSSRVAEARRQQMAEADLITVSDIIDLNLPDVDGKMHSLSELRGKVVLLDFHLFSTDQSAARILKLRELYNKYHDRGLEIYQVSIDQDEHLWKQAVEALPWVSVYDPSGAACLRYNVQTLPEFFLIDRNNALQKRSSQIDDLDAEMERLL
jgi:peroxiredoxin